MNNFSTQVIILILHKKIPLKFNLTILENYLRENKNIYQDLNRVIQRGQTNFSLVYFIFRVNNF